MITMGTSVFTGAQLVFPGETHSLSLNTIPVVSLASTLILAPNSTWALAISLRVVSTLLSCS